MRSPFSEQEYPNKLAEMKKWSGAEGIDTALKQHKLDMLIAPTNQPGWKIDNITGDHFVGSAAGPAARAGYPHITVPMGFVSGMPVGLSFFAGAMDEPKLIEAAYSFEQASQARRAPQLD